MKSGKFEKKHIANISNLPTLPEVAQQLIQIINDPDTSSSQVADLISKDVGITSKVLRMANSAFYGIPRTITTVQNAVVLLGMKVVNSLVLSVSVGDMFPSNKNKSGLSRVSFWKHSLATAITSKVLAKKMKVSHPPDPEECFCSGLLHDIGKLVLDQYFFDAFLSAIQSAQAQSISSNKSEVEVFGYSHTHVGDWLTSKWELPRNLRLPIIHHHEIPTDGPAKANIAIVQLADNIAHQLNYNCYQDEVTSPIQEECYDLLRITPDETAGIIEQLPKEIEKLEAAFSFA